MSVKTRLIVTPVVLVTALAFGSYYLGRGGKLDTSNDRDILMTVDYTMERANFGLVFVYINDANRTDDSFRDHWEDHMWVRPGEKIKLSGHVQGKGSLTCTITDRDKTYRNDVFGDQHWSDNVCTLLYVGH